MVLAGCSFSNTYYGSTRTIEDQPNQPFKSYGNEGIYPQGKHGGGFQHKAAARRRTDHSHKGDEEQACDAIDQSDDQTIGIGADQFQPDAKYDQSFEGAEQQPDQLAGFKGKDALFATRFAL